MLSSISSACTMLLLLSLCITGNSSEVYKRKSEVQPLKNVSYPLAIFNALDAFAELLSYDIPPALVVDRKIAITTASPHRTTERTSTEQLEVKKVIKRYGDNLKTGNVSASYILMCAIAGIVLGWVMMECMDDSDVISDDSVHSDISNAGRASSESTLQTTATSSSAGDSTKRDKPKSKLKAAISLPLPAKARQLKHNSDC